MQNRPVVFFRLLIYFLSIFLMGSVASMAAGTTKPYLGFDVRNSLVPLENIQHGGPPRDGIPAIDQPKFIDSDKADHISDEEPVLGLVLNGQARAYPISILNWHEIVNDKIGGKPITISYCPLCGTGMAFDGAGAGSFGVSGLLYNSDMLPLTTIPLLHTSWKHWKSVHPDGKVLSKDTGYTRDYSRSPYLGYSQSDRLYFKVDNRDNRYHNKENIIALSIGGKHKVWPFSELMRSKSPLKDHLNGEDLIIHYEAKKNHAWITDRQGNLLPGVRAFWFAWMAFYPNSEVFKSNLVERKKAKGQ
jgi:hypothetical protein